MVRKSSASSGNSPENNPWAMPVNPSRHHHGYSVTAAGFAIWFIGWGTFTPGFGVFLKPLLAEFGWTRAEASLAYSLSLLVMAVAGIGMGWLTDRLGPRIVTMVFGAFAGISYLLMPRVTTLLQFQLNWALLGGIGASTFTVPVMATLSRWYVKKRGFMIGIVQAGMGVGGVLFPPFTGWLILTYGWRSAYTVLGLITLTGIVVSGFFLRRDPAEAGQLPDGMLTTAGRVAEQAHLNPQGPGLSFGEALRTRQFWIIAGLFCTFGFCRSAFTIHIAAHVQDLGFGLADGANILAVIVGASMFGRIGMGRVADMIGNRLTFILSFGATTVSLMVGSVAGSLWSLVLFALIFGLAWGNQAVLRFALTSEVFGLASLGVMMGVFGLSESLAATFGSYFAGYVFDVAGSYRPVFWTGIGVSLTGTILAVFLAPAKSMSEGHGRDVER
jgi:MFS family permease